MIIDTSALVAILAGEPEAPAFMAAIANASAASISAATYLETGIVIDSRNNPALSRAFDDLLVANGISVEPVTPAQAKLAREAYRDFGKGSGHKAGLNFGDCFSYALAADSRRPLLYKGEDFTHAGLACVT
jgi:ribonuclease VapC